MMGGGGARRGRMWGIIQEDRSKMNDGRGGMEVGHVGHYTKGWREYEGGEGGGKEGEGTNNMQCTTHSKQHVKQSCYFLHFFAKFLKKQYPDIVTSRYMHQQSNWGKHKT